jgi:antitoxin VapB
MALSIKNAETERLSRELAALTGESVTEAVTVAVRARLESLAVGDADPAARAARILALGRQIASGLGDAKVEDLYDERGLPA